MTAPGVEHDQATNVAAGSRDRQHRVRYRGRLDALTAPDRRALIDRSTSSDNDIRTRTAEIIARVRREGDGALVALAAEFDGVQLAHLEVPRTDVQRALDKLEPNVRGVLERSASNIAHVHQACLPQVIETQPEPGILIGRRPDPLGRVGVYAPGGQAVYPSSVLMGVVPARVAGVGEVVLCSPPQRTSGALSPIVLAAAAIAGVDRVFAIGGAGAIAAMAYGTSTVPRVDRILGPGNAYVAEAKLQVAGAVAIDAPAGPSELLVIATRDSDPAVVAREMLAQAEHDALACAVAVVVGESAASAVEVRLEEMLARQPRASVISSSLARNGAVLWTDSLDAALAFANDYAAEHLLVTGKDVELVLPQLRNQGTVFLGDASSNAFGDYMTGANHVLPTGGLARSYSGLSVLEFFRWTTYQRVSSEAAARLATDVATFADQEGLPGHALAARDAGGISRTGSARPSSPVPSVLPRFRSSYRRIHLYNPDRAPSPIDLSDNTNLWGVPPTAKRLLESSASEVVTRYPSLYAHRLKEALAAYVGVRPDMVVTGCGSDDVLDSALRAFAEPGDRVAHIDPTFPALPIFARMNALEPVPVSLTHDYDADVDRLLAAAPRVIYLCAPNNPTGTMVSRRAIERLVDEASGIVILDEAYAEFADANGLDLLARSERLLISRTMSKAFGLAGLRVGYAIGAPSLVAEVEKSRGPYKVSALAERAALAALGDDIEWVRAHVTAARSNREQLTAALRAAGHSPVDSHANFVLVPMPGAVGVTARMRQLGVAVRPFSALPTVSPALRASNGDAIRISVGPWSMLQRALAALATALDERTV